MEFLASIPSPIWGMLGIVFGGVGNEIVKRRTAAQTAKSQESTDIRKELWNELDALRERMKRLEEELTEWKDKYFVLYEEKAQLVADKSVLQADNIILRAKVTTCEANHIG